MKGKVLSYVIWFCLFFILANSILYLEEVLLIRMLVSMLRMFSVLVAIGLAVKNKNFGGGFTWWVCGFFLILGSITFVKHGALNMIMSYFINSVGISLLIYNAFKESPKMAINVLANVFAAYIYLNFVTLLIAPDGLFNGSYLIGRNYNQIGMTLVCGMVTNVAAYNAGKKSFTSVLILCLVALFSPIITGSMTSVVGCLVTLLFLFFKKQEQKKKLLIAFVAFYFIFQGFVVFMQSDVSSIRLITYIIEELMGKDLSFTDRARVWLVAFDMIQDAPVIGYGFQNNDWFEFYFEVKSAHNVIFQMLLYGGSLLLGYLVLLIIRSVRKSLKKPSLPVYTLLLGLCTVFFMMMMENYNMILILYLLCLLYNSPMLSKVLIAASTAKSKKEIAQ